VTRRIIDAHSHIGRTVANGVGQDGETWRAAMEVAGIGQAIISVAAGGLQAEGLADTRRANDVIANAVREHPDRFPIGLASIEVRHGEAGLAEVRRVMTEIGLSGLVFHTTFEGFGVDSSVFDSILRALGEGPALVLMHSTPDGRGNPTAIAAVAHGFPQIQFLLGHPVFTEEQRKQCVEAVRVHANINLDLAYQADPATTEFFVREVGAGRVLYGSDAPYFEPARVIASIEAAKITEPEREQIFSGNAERLIEAVRSRPD
jgi:predicted TIM-barrel fold metal-dependent hydrolase